MDAIVGIIGLICGQWLTAIVWFTTVFVAGVAAYCIKKMSDELRFMGNLSLSSLRNRDMYDKRTCAECANFECQSFSGMGKCKVDVSTASYNDEACDENIMDMQREIKFRGKRLDNGEWVFFTLPFDGRTDYYDVGPNTVGQFTGLKDNNGRDIYEGDIIDINYKYDACGIPDQDCACLGVVLYNQYTAAYELRLIKAEYPIDVKGYDEEYSLNLYDFDLEGGIELCGNIHDNPESLKTE